MILNAYSVFDEKAFAFLPPWFCMTDAVALRHFTQAARDGNTDIGRFPEDYKLFRLGTFNDTSGTIGAEPSGPVFLALASTVKAGDAVQLLNSPNLNLSE